MDVNDISSCLTLIEEALNSDIFKYEQPKIRTDRLINKLESKCKHNKSPVSIYSKSDKSKSDRSNNSNSDNSNNSNNSKSDLELSDSTKSSEYMSDSAVSGNYSNIKPLTIASDLFNLSESHDVDSNSCYNMAFSYNNVDNTEVDAKIITYRK